MPITSAAGSSFFVGRKLGIVTNVSALPSLQVWYDAADSTQFNPTNPSDGTGITQWKDKSAFAHNASPSGGASVRPTYRTSVLNSKNIVRFDGVDDNLSISPATWTASLSGFSTFVVAKASTLSGTRTLTSTDLNGLKIFYNGSYWGVSTSGGTGISTVSGDTTQFRIFSMVYDGSKSTNADRLIFRYAKNQQTLSFTGTVGATTNASNSVLNIGFYNNSEYFGGDIAEIIFLSRAVSGSDLSAIEGYLSNKWNI